MKILIVDDEPAIVKALKHNLDKEGYETDIAYDGKVAFDKIHSGIFDMVLLDVMLPGIPGTEICREVRRFSDIPIIMVSAKDTNEDKIKGLECGADDYISKPYNLGEVLARIRAVSRRTQGFNKDNEISRGIIECGDITLNYDLRIVIVNGNRIELTSKEFLIFAFLIQHPNTAYTREDLLRLALGEHDNTDPAEERKIDVHIRRLREKIEPVAAEPLYIKTKWGVGYYYHKN